MALILTGSSGSTTLDSSAGLTFSDSSNQQYAASPYVLKNRIINGDMRIAQYSTSSITPTNASYGTVDRWQFRLSQASKYTAQQNAGSVTPPTGFTNYLGITSSSAYTVGSTDNFVVQQLVEANNVSDLAWGTANAQTVTLSFWVRSSLTGTFGGSIFEYNSGVPCYPFSYTISSANTWTKISVTISGPTSGTFLTGNNGMFSVSFSLGCGSTYQGTANTWNYSTYYKTVTGETQIVGTNGATFYITGVQLEIGSTATPFERRLYNQELANCQRYFFKYAAPVSTGAGVSSGVGVAINTTLADNVITAPVSMRVSGNNVTPTVNSMQIYVVSTGTAYNTGTWSIPYDTNNNEFILRYTHGSGVFTAGGTVLLVGNSTTGYVSLSAEL